MPVTRKALFLAAVALSTLIASDSTPVPPEIEAEYYRTDARVAHMKADWDAANTDLQTAIAAVQKACGDKSVPSTSADGKHLVCVPKPEPPKPETKTETKK